MAFATSLLQQHWEITYLQNSAYFLQLLDTSCAPAQHQGGMWCNGEALALCQVKLPRSRIVVSDTSTAVTSFIIWVLWLAGTGHLPWALPVPQTYSCPLPVGMEFGKVVMKRRLTDQRDVAPKFTANSLQVRLDLGSSFNWAYSKLLFSLGKWE